MRHVYFLLSLLGLGMGAAAQTPAPGPGVTVEVSRVHCLVRFVSTLAGDGYAGSRRVFEKSRLNTPAAQRWLRRYRQLDAYPNSQLEGYPAGRLGA